MFTSAEKQLLVAKWKKSGQTKMEFSKSIGVNYHTFINWISPKKLRKVSKLNSTNSAGVFSELKITAPQPANLFARIAVGKTSVDLFQPVSAGFLKQLLST